MSQRKTLSKRYAYVRNPVWIETAVLLFFLYICHTVIHRKLQKVHVILKSVSDPMLCATFTYSIMSTGGH
jgi:hypothetical protein